MYQGSRKVHQSLWSYRNSHRRYSVQKGIFLKIHKFRRKKPALESLFNKVSGLEACNFIKKRFQHRFFPGRFAKSLRTPILKSSCEQLLLELIIVFLKKSWELRNRQLRNWQRNLFSEFFGLICCYIQNIYSISPNITGPFLLYSYT